MTTFALIPGAGSDQWYWSRLVPLLTARGHEALAPELPTGDPDAGWDAYADAVAAAIGDRTGVVVVGQSMGAFTAPLLCSRADVAHIALLCPMIPAPGDTGNEVGARRRVEQARLAIDQQTDAVRQRLAVRGGATGLAQQAVTEAFGEVVQGLVHAH